MKNLEFERERLEYLCDKAKDGTITAEEVAGIIPLIQSPDDRVSYLALYVVGRSFLRQYEAVVFGELCKTSDPLKVALALKILSDWWNAGDKYYEKLREFVDGVDWDDNDDLRLQAISTAGEYVRDRKSGPSSVPLGALLEKLIGILENDKARRILRESAYRALARAYGLDWQDLPSLAQHFDLDKEVDPKVVRWARSVRWRPH